MSNLLPADSSKNCKSAFTLTFVVEVIGIEVYHDCNEGWLELGPPVYGMKLQYQLIPGQNYEVDIVIWPHAAKVFCGSKYGWVRTWQFLERRWLTFSIRHSLPVRVVDFFNVIATVAPHAGLGAVSANSKNDKIHDVYLPPLAFGQRRQFAPVIESETPLKKYIEDLIWQCIVDYIPTSNMDGLIDTPYPVSDVRHQDAALYQVRETILNRKPLVETDIHESKKDVEKVKYEIKLSGDAIMAGIGRVVPFEVVGDPPPEQGEVLVLIGSTNLPAQDDLPVAFVNVDTLTDIPVAEFEKHRITHVYTRWVISEEEHFTDYQPVNFIENQNFINFKDHHSVPLPINAAIDIMTTLIDDPFQIELRGIRTPPPITVKPKFFGYEKRDRDFGVAVPPLLPNQDTDILIAVTRIDARILSKGNEFIKGDYPLYPPKTDVVPLNREVVCTNDINAVRAKIKPDLVIPPGVVLESQMSLEVSMGLVGCKPKNIASFSRMFCLISDPDAIMMILRRITEMNEMSLQSSSRDDLLTGFGLDLGDTVMLYVEGPRDGHILHVWEITENYHPAVKPVFSTSAKYRCRLYPELLTAAMPFNIMKMFVPLSVVLALTPVYARPALPLPTRSAVLKIGRIVTSNFFPAPCRYSMPTSLELKSFRLELCVAPRPLPLAKSSSGGRGGTEGGDKRLIKLMGQENNERKLSLESVSRINWDHKA